MLDKVSQKVTSVVGHIVMTLAFIVFNILGFVYGGGMDFVQGWGGGMAAVIATFFLMFKSKGYWTWMVVNASLWTYLFFTFDLPMLAFLQVSIILFSLYGLTQWIMVRNRIGFTPKIRSDLVGAILALGMFTYSVLAYYNMPGYVGSMWWWLEFGSVAFAIAAMWLDAFKYKANWIAWTISNCFAGPLFYHLAQNDPAMWGPFYTIFLYQTFNVIGFIIWWKDERKLVREGKVELVGAAGVL